MSSSYPFSGHDTHPFSSMNVPPFPCPDSHVNEGKTSAKELPLSVASAQLTPRASNPFRVAFLPALHRSQADIRR